MTITRLTAATAVAAALFGTAVKTQAQYAYTYDSPRGPFYVSADLGGTIVQSTKVRNAPETLSFEPGFRADFTFGYRIPQTLLAAEFETGGTWNSLTSGGYVTPPGFDTRLYQIPVLANLVLNVPLNDRLSLYVGAGAGGVASQIEQRGFGGSVSDTDFTFAYQGKVGVKYSFNPDMEVGLDYKFMGTLSHTWFNDSPLPLATDPIYSHSILASFTLRF